MKKKETDLHSTVGIVSLIMSFITVAGMIWIGGFRLSALIHDVQDLKDDVQRIDAHLDKMDACFERLENEFHKMDIRVNTLEQRKP